MRETGREKTRKTAVLIPCYNESQTIEKVIMKCYNKVVTEVANKI